MRLYVLDRDRWVCQMCDERIEPGLPKEHPMAAQVHHTRDRRVVGDDPRYLVAAHRQCNVAAGDPRTADPKPNVRKARIIRPAIF